MSTEPNPKSFAAFRRRWRLRLILWLAKDAGLTAHRYSVASKRGGPIDKRGLVFLDEGAFDAMKISFRVGFCNVAQSFLDDHRQDLMHTGPGGYVPRPEGSRDRRNNREARDVPAPCPASPEKRLPPIPVTEIRDGDVMLFRITKFASIDEVESMRSRIIAAFPAKVGVFFVGVGETTELIQVIRPSPKVETKAPDLDPATAKADMKAAGLA